VAKAPSTDQALQAIRAIRDSPESYDLKRDLSPFLRHKSNHVAAAAASTAERLEAGALAPDLVTAFLELMKDPAKRDPGCEALIAIAKALIAMDEAAAKVYFAGVRHVQMEGSFGPPVDAAAPLRGLCAQGLARMGHPEALVECVSLLADKEVPARIGAIRAIADSGDIAGTLEFVARFLKSASEEIRERAALALGESRLAAAFPVLREAWEQTAQAARRRTLLLSIAMLRLDEAVEFLLVCVAEDREAGAGDALAALGLYNRDEAVRTRVAEIVGKRASAVLKGAFEREFLR
jgi:HEAT repeat protein